MEYKISISKNSEYVICKVIGDIDINDGIIFSKKMDEKSRELKIPRMLLDLRKAKNISKVVENYDFAYKHMPEIDLQRNAIIAFLVAENDHSHDFTDTVIKNAGYDSKLFREEKKAIAWIAD